ncbi:MAG: hypothetical protein GY852_01005 [bacterium]|nr:hypothetical protein [bacterium]
MARMCIVSRKEVPKGEGTPVKEDAIIRNIRKIKGKLGILQNNELVVSDEKLEEYAKKRSKFEKMAVIHTTIAAVLVLLLTIGPLLLGAQFNLISVFFALVLGAMIVALALLGYVPALDTGEEEKPKTAKDVVERLAPKTRAKKPRRKKRK